WNFLYSGLFCVWSEPVSWNHATVLGSPFDAQRTYFFDMNRFTLLLVVACALAGQRAQAQEDEIIAEGRVVDARSGKAIPARIRYSSIPTGGISGRFYDSTFSFAIFGSAKYQITAESDGYNPRTVIVNPSEVLNNTLRRDIVLTPKGETIILNNLIFARGKATIDPKSFRELDE